MEEIKAFWEGVVEVLQQPIVIGGVSFTLIGLLWLIIRSALSMPKNKQITLLSSDLSDLRKNSDNYIDKDKYNLVIAYLEKLTYFTKDLLNTIKNEETREDFKRELAEIENTLPHEIVKVVEEQPKETKKPRF